MEPFLHRNYKPIAQPTPTTLPLTCLYAKVALKRTPAYLSARIRSPFLSLLKSVAGSPCGTSLFFLEHYMTFP